MSVDPIWNAPRIQCEILQEFSCVLEYKRVTDGQYCSGQLVDLKKVEGFDGLQAKGF